MDNKMDMRAVACVLLAAGAGSRFGGGKLLAEVFRQGVDLLRQLSDQAAGTAAGPRHLVPHSADESPEAVQRG